MNIHFTMVGYSSIQITNILARIMFYIRQQLFINEMTIVNYYKRKTFGTVYYHVNPLEENESYFNYIKPPSKGEILIRSYQAMELLTKTGRNDPIGVRELKHAENLLTQFVTFKGKQVYSLVRADDINGASEISKKHGLETSSYTVLSLGEGENR